MTVFGLVSADALLREEQARGAVVLDTRSAQDYWTGHIPGARHIDPSLLSVTRTDQAALDRLHAILSWAFSALGITPKTPVIVVGAQNEANAARVAWALAYAGVEHVSLFDGGVNAWQGELSREAPAVVPTQFELRPQTAYLATAADVLAAINGGGTVLDTREWDDYAGKRSNAQRKGRVPGARFWEARNELDANGKFASAQFIAEKAAAVAAPADKAILYCGGGGRAARSFLALQLAGYAQAAVYPASWNEWGNVDAYPVDASPL